MHNDDYQIGRDLIYTDHVRPDRTVSTQPSGSTGSTDEDEAEIPLLEADSSSEEERRPQTRTPMVLQGCESADTHTLVNGISKPKNNVSHLRLCHLKEFNTLCRHQLDVTQTYRAMNEGVGLFDTYKQLLAVDEMEAEFFKQEVLTDLS